MNQDPPLVSSLLTAPSPAVRPKTRSRHIQRLNESGHHSLIFSDEPEDIPSTSLFTPERLIKTSDSFAVGQSFSSAAELSNTFGPAGRNETIYDASFDISTGNDTFLRDENPSIKATSSLYQNFYEVYQSHPSEHQIFELLQQYENVCTDTFSILKSIVKKSKMPKNSQVAQLKSELQQERNTWRLVRILYDDRINSETNVDPDISMMDTVGKKMSDKQIIDNLYERDSSVRQMQLIVDWLEKNAADELEDEKFEENFLSDTGKAWENTLHVLQNRHKNIVGLDFPNSYVTEMDPDAPLRQNASLHDLDVEDQNKLLKFMFSYLRAGQLDQAQRLAEKAGHFWLSAALEGWRLFHDPNFDTPPGPNSPPQMTEGNKFRDIWKAVCWQNANETKLPLYERGLYAVLCGNLNTLTTICQSWEDQLWSYIKVLLDIRIEQELQYATQQERNVEHLPGTYWEQVFSLEQVFKDLDLNPNKKIQERAKMPFNTIQKYIILDNVDGLIEEMYEWVRNQSGQISHHLVRFMAHLVLFFRIIGWTTKEELCVAILEAYVNVLIKERHITLVATYASTLPPNQQVLWYAKFLEKITESAEQQLCLKLAKEAGLNISLITKQVVENIRQSGSSITMPLPALSEETTQEDMQKINALDWLIFEVSQRSEAVRQANTLMRMFVLSGKLDATKAVFMKVPPDSLDSIIKQWRKHTGGADLLPEDDNAAREYLCFQAYLQAHSAFQDWFQHYHTGKPTEPERPSGSNVKFTQWVAYEAQVKQYEDDLKKWEWSLEIQTKNTIERIYNVLLFVDGGWMVDQRTDGETDENRQNQLSQLRKKCIPEMCFLLHSVLHATQKYRECLQLADVVACEKNKLYNEFSKHQLQDFLSKLRESSLELLDHNLDPFGYPIQ